MSFRLTALLYLKNRRFLNVFLFLNFIFFAGFTFIAISSRRPAFIPRGLPFPFSFFLSFFVVAWFFLLHSHNHSFNAWYPNLHGWGKDAFCCMRFKFIFRSFLFSFVCFSEYCVRSVKVYIKISHLISIQTKSHCTTAKAILSLEYPYFHVLENGPITARRIFVFRDYLSVVPTRHCADEINVATLTGWWYFHSECLTVLWRVTFSFRVLLQLAQLSGSAPSLESEQVVQRRCTLDRECRKRTQDTRFLQSRPFFFLLRFWYVRILPSCFSGSVCWANRVVLSGTGRVVGSTDDGWPTRLQPKQTPFSFLFSTFFPISFKCHMFLHGRLSALQHSQLPSRLRC